MTMAYGGHPGEIAALRDLADDRGLVLLEDAAHAIGVRHGGRHLGTFGAAGAFSFFSNKNLAVGEGGAVVTDDDELAARMRAAALARHDDADLGPPPRPRRRLRRRRARLQLPDRRAARRARSPPASRGSTPRPRAAASSTRATASGCPTASPRPPAPAHHIFTVVLDAGHRPRRRPPRARTTRGIQTSLHYPPAHRFSIYADGALELPLTEAYAAHAVTLPLFATMTDAQQDLVVDALAEAL